MLNFAQIDNQEIIKISHTVSIRSQKMQKRPQKLDQLLKKAKFRHKFQISLYINQFISISLAKQGYYYIAVTLCPKCDLNQTIKDVGMCRNNSTKVIKIQYNNHTEIMDYLATFSFLLEQPLRLPNSSNPSTLKSSVLLIFQLLRNKSQPCDQSEKKNKEQEYETVSKFIYQLNIKQGLSFLQYYNLRFQYPYAAELDGFAACLMTDFEAIEDTKSPGDFMPRLQIIEGDVLELGGDRSERYSLINSCLKKLLKKYMFSSFTIQKALAEAMIGYKKSLSIPQKQPISEKQDEYQLIRSSLCILQKNNASHNKQKHKQREINHYEQKQFELQNFQATLIQQQPELTQSIVQPSTITTKFLLANQKQCTQEQFIKHLTFIEYQQRSICQIIKDIHNVGLKNLNIAKEINKCVKINNESGTGFRRVNLQDMEQEYYQNKFLLYNQKLSFFGCSLPSASQQMKFYQKQISTLKSKLYQSEKQNYFTKMSQVFNLIHESNGEFQGQASRFDKCPFIFYSYEKFLDGLPTLDKKDEEDFTNQLQEEDKTIIENKKQYKNVFILAHGYQATCANMEKLKIHFKKIFSKSKFLVLRSYSSQMDRSLQQMGQKAAKQIENFIGQVMQSYNKKILRVIMVGHSMGGIILRASIKHLHSKIKDVLHTFISFATPHLGYLHCKSFITGTGIKLIESMHPSISLKQLSNKDHLQIKQTFIYKLADLGSLKYFKNIVVMSSIEDKYVPWNSARLQLYKKAEGVGGKSTTGGWLMNSEKQYLRYVQQEMLNQILGIGQKTQSKIKNLYRFEVDFNVNHVNLDTVIGRTSHVAFLTNQHILEMVFRGCLQKSLYEQLRD